MVLVVVDDELPKIQLHLLNLNEYPGIVVGPHREYVVLTIVMRQWMVLHLLFKKGISFIHASGRERERERCLPLTAVMLVNIASTIFLR